MDDAIIRFRTDQLGKYFDPTNARRVMEWLIAGENRRPVVLVGAGFSRNARHRLRPGYARSDEVPLWWHLAKKMADHLQVDVAKYDAPTMADMYASSFGDAELRDLLRNALLDDYLSPGEAHQALSSYKAAAVVTTNFLDTLLDTAKHERWNRVIADADLAASAKDGGEHVDLIYFHGHRCASDTWVMTRSQYEDVARKKPVIVARVRQLMAQHPLLIVGFGMSDPNFHNLYRQVGLDMSYSQPLGLSVQLTDVSEAERRHWDELGIRTAVPKELERLRQDAAESNKFFAWLFQQVATSWSPDESMVLSWACTPSDIAKRLRRIDHLLPHQWQERSHERQTDWRTHRFAAWEKVLFSILTDAERAAAVETVRRVNNAEHEARTQRFRKATTITGEEPKLPVNTTQQANNNGEREIFQELPDWPELRRDDEQTWRLDKVLVHARNSADAVAEHFVLGFRLDLFRVQAAERRWLPWIPLTFWLAVRANTLSKEAIERLAGDCFAQCKKFGDDAWASRIETEATARNISISQIVAERTSAETRSSEYQAFQAMLNGDYVSATQNYSSAADRARQEQADFKEWAWRNGELRALFASADSLIRPSTAETEEDKAARDARRHALRDRIAHLEETRTVRAWLDQAKQRLVDALEHVLERREASASYRRAGGSGHSFSASPYLAWRSFRELEEIYAPPFLQEEYLAPLLWDGGFSPQRELGYRMLFDRKRTREWLKQLLDSPSSTRDKQAERDAALMNTFWSATAERHTKTERYGQLIVANALSHAMRVADIPELADWLLEIRQVLGVQVTTYGSHSYLDREYADGLSTLAQFGTCAQTRKILETWKPGVREFERREFAQRFISFPWTRWALTEPIEVSSWLKAIAEGGVAGWFSGDRQANTLSPSIRMGDDFFMFGVYTMIDALKQSGPALLNEELRTALETLTDELHRTPLRDEHSWEARRGGHLLEQILGYRGLSQVELYRRWTSRDAATLIDGHEYQQLWWSIVADSMLDTGAPQVGMLEALADLWHKIEPSDSGFAVFLEVARKREGLRISRPPCVT